MTNVPKLRVPFQIIGGKALTVEQDSEDEVEQCVEAIVRTPVGTRIDEPEFGIPDPTFESGPEVNEVVDAIAEWEPRADPDVTEDGLDSMIRTIRVENLSQEESTDG